MDAWRPAPNAYGACSNTESANRREGAVSAIGIESSAGGVIGKRRWIPDIHSWFWTRVAARRGRAGGRWSWWHLDSGIDGDLALLLAVRSQHDGVDWDRLVCPAPRGQHDGVDWDCDRDQGESVP